MPENIKLVTLDLDDTLWPCMPTIVRAEQALYDWLEYNAPDILLTHDMKSMRRHRLAVMQKHPDIAYDLTRVREMSLIEIGRQSGYDAELMRHANQHFRDWRNQVKLYPEVEAILCRLADHYSLISVTNGNADVAQTALSGVFDHELTASDVGAAKPDPAIFHRAATLAGVELHDAVHVGDDPKLDVAVAQSLGMRTVWMNREAKTWPSTVARADRDIASLEELPQVLQQWGEG